MDIRVGDVVQVMEDEEVPADLVVIRSAKKDGVVYVDTANLDGFVIQCSNMGGFLLLDIE